MVAELTAPKFGGWRFSAHLGILRPDAPLLAALAGSVDPTVQIARAAELGFSAVTDNCLKMRAPKVRRRMGEALRAHGLAMGSFTHNMPASEPPFFWGARTAELERALAATLAAAADVGGGCVNAILLDSGDPPADQLARAADNLAAAAELCAANGVTMAVEAISRARVPLALTEGVEVIARLVRSAGPPLGLILDSAHCHCAGDDMADAIIAQADILAGVQLADMPGRVEPGAGTMDFAPILAALRAIGWKGLVEAEFMPSTPGPAGERAALAALRALG